MRSGDVLFFNGSLVHGSTVNRTTDRFRRSLIGHYVHAGVRQIAGYYHPALTMDGTPLPLDVSPYGGPCGEWAKPRRHPSHRNHRAAPARASTRITPSPAPNWVICAQVPTHLPQIPDSHGRSYSAFCVPRESGVRSLTSLSVPGVTSPIIAPATGRPVARAATARETRTVPRWAGGARHRAVLFALRAGMAHVKRGQAGSLTFLGSRRSRPGGWPLSSAEGQIGCGWSISLGFGAGTLLLYGLAELLFRCSIFVL